MKNINKTLLYVILMVIINYTNNNATAQSVAVNTTGNAADTSAALDITSSYKGILIPRVSLTSTSDNTTIKFPATSLMVFNTNEAITGTYASGTGFYYNSGNADSVSWRKFVGQGETRWDDLRITLDKGSNSAALDYLNGSTGPQIWYFRNNQGVEAMSFTVQLPHSWKEGTDIFPHLHWTPRNTGSGNVEWNFEYTWVNYDPVTQQVFPNHTTETVVSTGPFTARTHNISALTPSNEGISGSGKKISSILVCRLWRNSSNSADTYGNDVGVLFVDFHFQVDSWGSRQEYIK